MRNRILLLCALSVAVLAGTSCDKIKPGITVPFTMASFSFPVNPGPGGNVESSGQNIKVNLDSIMDANGASGFKLSSAVLTGVEFMSVSGENFDPFENASAWLSADGQPEKQVAHKDMIENGLTTVIMDSENVDVAPYLNADNLSFKAKTFVSEPIPTEREVSVTLKYDLKFVPGK